MSTKSVTTVLLFLATTSTASAPLSDLVTVCPLPVGIKPEVSVEWEEASWIVTVELELVDERVTLSLLLAELLLCW